jgi:hypothetical protein
MSDLTTDRLEPPSRIADAHAEPPQRDRRKDPRRKPASVEPDAKEADERDEPPHQLDRMA